MSHSILDRDELDDRLRTMFDVVMPLLDDAGSRPGVRVGPDRRRGVVAAAAAVAVVGAGVVATLALRPGSESVSHDAAAPSSALPVQASATTSTTSVSGGDADTIPLAYSDDDSLPSPWDAIRVAPGTIGWYDINVDALAPEIQSVLGQRDAWSADYISRFYRCVAWAESDDGAPTCTKLATGGREFVSYGGQGDIELGDGGVGIGTNLVASDPKELLWSLGAGSLWGYDTVTEPPEPTEVAIGQRTGYQYRNGDAAYLLWEQEPGVFVWLKGQGLDDTTLVALAESVVPVPVPGQLPLQLSLEDEAGSPEPRDDFVEITERLVLGWVDGRPCVTFGASDGCTPVGDEPLLIVDEFPVGDPLVVAAIGPRESGLTLEVDVFDVGTRSDVQFVDAFGWSAAVYRPGADRPLAARLIGEGGEVLASREFTVADFIGAWPGGVVAEGRTDGRAWVVVRQDPDDPGGAPMPYGDGSEYCWLLTAPTQHAALCLSGPAPTTGLGTHPERHDDLDLIEVAADVESAACGDIELPIYTDEQHENRRFIVSPCDYGDVTVLTG